MTAYEILNHHGLVLGSAKKASVRRAWSLADDNGEISQAGMTALTKEPSMHRDASLTEALIHIGCGFRGVSEWKSRGNRAA